MISLKLRAQQSHEYTRSAVGRGERGDVAMSWKPVKTQWRPLKFCALWKMNFWQQLTGQTEANKAALFIYRPHTHTLAHTHPHQGDKHSGMIDELTTLYCHLFKHSCHSCTHSFIRSFGRSFFRLACTNILIYTASRNPHSVHTLWQPQISWDCLGSKQRREREEEGERAQSSGLKTGYKFRSC